MRRHLCLNYPIFDPSPINWNGWWRGSYTASPWAGTASAGTSGANSISEATNPPSVGVSLPVNGNTPITAASFDGTNDILTGAAISTYLTASAYSMAVLFRPTSAGTSVAADSGQVLTDTNSAFSIGCYTSGAQTYLTASHGSTQKISSPFTLNNQWCLYIGSYNTWSLNEWESSMWVEGIGLVQYGTVYGLANLTSTAGTLRVGASKASYARFFNGNIAEIMISPTSWGSYLSTYRVGRLYDYFKRRYGINF